MKFKWREAVWLLGAVLLVVVFFYIVLTAEPVNHECEDVDGKGVKTETSR